MLRVVFIVFALHEPNWPEVIYIVKNIHVVLLSLYALASLLLIKRHLVASDFLRLFEP